MDEIAFRGFYDRTAPALRSYLRMLCKNTATADDLLQETYLRFLRAPIPDMNEFQMKAYLYKAAHSAAQNQKRAEMREQRRSNEIPAWGEAARDQSSSYEMKRLFLKLKGQQQTLLWLAYVEGFQHREIAQILSLKEKSIRVLLSRARNELSRMFTAEGIGPGKQP